MLAAVPQRPAASLAKHLLLALLFLALAHGAHERDLGLSAPARRRNGHGARLALARVAELRAAMAARQGLVAWPAARRDGILARGSLAGWLGTAWAGRDASGREGADGRFGLERVAWLLA